MTNSGQILSNKVLSEEIPNNEYAVEGLRYWLNNKPEQSEQHFRARISDTPILAGYAFILCMVRYIRLALCVCVWFVYYLLHVHCAR